MKRFDMPRNNYSRLGRILSQGEVPALWVADRDRFIGTTEPGSPIWLTGSIIPEYDFLIGDSSYGTDYAVWRGVLITKEELQTVSAALAMGVNLVAVWLEQTRDQPSNLKWRA